MEHAIGIGTVTREMVTERAIELAIIGGGSAQSVSNADWEQAKRELTGGVELDPKEEILEAAPESERWDPIPGSTGTQAPETSSEDEDDDGRSDSAVLVEEGVHEAEHDRMLQGAKVKTEFDEE